MKATKWTTKRNYILVIKGFDMKKWWKITSEQSNSLYYATTINENMKKPIRQTLTNNNQRTRSWLWLSTPTTKLQAHDLVIILIIGFVLILKKTHAVCTARSTHFTGINETTPFFVSFSFLCVQWSMLYAVVCLVSCFCIIALAVCFQTKSEIYILYLSSSFFNRRN